MAPVEEGAPSSELFSWNWSIEPPDDPWSSDFEVAMTRADVREFVSTLTVEWADARIASAAAVHFFGDVGNRVGEHGSIERNGPFARYLDLAFGRSGRGLSAPLVLRSKSAAALASDMLRRPGSEGSDLRRLDELDLAITLCPRGGAVASEHTTRSDQGRSLDSMAPETLLRAAEEHLAAAANRWDVPRGLRNSELRRRTRILRGDAPLLTRLGEALASSPWIVVVSTRSDMLRHLEAPDDPWRELNWVS